jgi:hypothetical protein
MADEAIKPCTSTDTCAAIPDVEYHELNDEQMAEARAEALARILGMDQIGSWLSPVPGPARRSRSSSCSPSRLDPTSR